MTLELWRDPANDAEASCCSAHAVRLARSVAHRMGLPHFTLDLRAGVRRRRRRAVPRRPRRRADAEPVRALQRRRAARRDARLRRPARRRRPRDRPLRARHAPTGCCAPPPTPPRTRATCSPRSRPASLARMRFPLGELTQAGGARARARGRAAGRRQARVAGPLLPRRDRQERVPRPPRRRCASGPARSSTAPAARSAATAASTCSRSASARGSASAPRRSRSTCSRKDRAANTVTVGTRAELATTEVAVRDAVLHRPATEVDRVKLRYRTTPLACRVRAGDGGRAARCSSPSRSTAPRPARSPA